MKKIICILVSLLIMGTTSFAQDKAKKPEPPKKAATTAKEKKEATQPTTKPGTLTNSGPVKKDGTPDKRFKENKAAKPAGPLKKDGTPDMRYKANKDAAKKK